MLKQIINKKWFAPRTVVGFWPANAVSDAIQLFTGDDRKNTIATFHTQRQQHTKQPGRHTVSLSDFVAPEGASG